MILTNMAVRRPEGADAVDLTDLTTDSGAVQVGPAFWSPAAVDELVIPMDPEPSPAEQTAIRRRLATVDADDEANLHDLLAQRKALTGLEPPLLVRWLDDRLRAYGETT
jgi:hypothetical protein